MPSDKVCALVYYTPSKCRRVARRELNSTSLISFFFGNGNENGEWNLEMWREYHQPKIAARIRTGNILEITFWRNDENDYFLKSILFVDFHITVFITFQKSSFPTPAGPEKSLFSGSGDFLHFHYFIAFPLNHFPVIYMFWLMVGFSHGSTITFSIPSRTPTFQKCINFNLSIFEFPGFPFDFCLFSTVSGTRKTMDFHCFVRISRNAWI